MHFFIDTHCHLDAAEFGTEATAIRAHAAIKSVAHCVIPAVTISNFEAARALVTRPACLAWYKALLAPTADLPTDLFKLENQLICHANAAQLQACNIDH